MSKLKGRSAVERRDMLHLKSIMLYKGDLIERKRI